MMSGFQEPVGRSHLIFGDMPVQALGAFKSWFVGLLVAEL